MKKIFFLFAVFVSVAGFAQDVQVKNIRADYSGGTPTVTFSVSWTGARTFRHNTQVWVFVDYHNMENNAPSGSWTRALVASTPTVSSSPASTATLVNGNNKGFWLHGVDGDYSATVTVPLSGVPAQFNWCAYATDSPPNVEIKGGNSYTLHGSPPFVINNTPLPLNQATYSGTIISFTDATGAPGLFPAALGEAPNGMGCIAGLADDYTTHKCVVPADAGCNSGTLNLGTVGFSSGSEITIVSNGVSQIWSRPVTATGCNKSSFDAGSQGAMKTDCRRVTGYGDYFSFCAAVHHANQLCPYPWRIPTMKDAANLDIALNGKGYYRTNVPASEAYVYINIWGGVINGHAHDNTYSAQGYYMIYMSTTFTGGAGAYTGIDIRFEPDTYGYSICIGCGQSFSGLQLRCIRDR
jgi:hypothetical protein